jgi:hypothetical protein
MRLRAELIAYSLPLIARDKGEGLIPSRVQAETHINVLPLLDGRAGPLGHAGTAQSDGIYKSLEAKAIS